MAATNPNKADVYQLSESFPFLSGKINNYQADVYQLGESFQSLAPISTLRQPRYGFVNYQNPGVF